MSSIPYYFTRQTDSGVEAMKWTGYQVVSCDERKAFDLSLDKEDPLVFCWGNRQCYCIIRGWAEYYLDAYELPSDVIDFDIQYIRVYDDDGVVVPTHKDLLDYIRTSLHRHLNDDRFKLTL